MFSESFVSDVTNPGTMSGLTNTTKQYHAVIGDETPGHVLDKDEWYSFTRPAIFTLCKLMIISPGVDIHFQLTSDRLLMPSNDIAKG